jgi:hypothetical protein
MVSSRPEARKTEEKREEEKRLGIMLNRVIVELFNRKTEE